MTQHLEYKAALSVDDTGAITGTAWPFSGPDRVGDEIQPGAFANITGPLPMLWSHDQAQVIGVWDTIEEKAEGLTVTGRLLVKDVARAKEVRAMILEKAVTGLSIGFQTKATTPKPRGRQITALDLVEISIVAVPCHPGAKITSAKSADDDTALSIGEIMEPEIKVETPAQTTPANDAPGIDTKAFEEIRARLDRMEAKAARPQGVTITGPAISTERKAFDIFIRRGVERMSADEIKSLNVTTDANGGFLAPEEFGNELLKKLVEFSPVRQYARVVQTGAQEIVYPRRLTGTAAVWVAEDADRTASSPTFDQVRITPHELGTFVDVSNALLEDNQYALEGELISDFAESFGKAEGLAFVKGTGTGQPKGLFAAGTGIAEIKTGVAANFPASNPADVLIAMYHALPHVYAQNGVWAMNRTTLATVRTWKDGQGRYLLADPITAGAPMTILGRPVIEMIDMDSVAANAFPILFGDFSGYRIVDRVSLAVLRDPYSVSLKGQVRIHARKRVGADLTHPEKFLKLKVAA